MWTGHTINVIQAICESIFISASSLAQIIRAACFCSVRTVVANPNKCDSELSTANSQAWEQESVGLFLQHSGLGLVIRLHCVRSLKVSFGFWLERIYNRTCITTHHMLILFLLSLLSVWKHNLVNCCRFIKPRQTKESMPHLLPLRHHCHLCQRCFPVRYKWCRIWTLSPPKWLFDGILNP